jgi:HSP20 family protein
MVLPHHMPGRFINDLASDMNALVGTIFGEEPSDSGFVPAMDIEETESGFKLSIDVPGVNPDDISIEVEDGYLTIQGERHIAEKSDEVSWRRVERSHGEFLRRFRLPKGVDQERIEADHVHGVLNINLPKVEKKAAKRILIGHSGSEPTADSTESEAG